MGVFIVKQPNGKYCRFSTIVDCPTHINMSEEDYINLCMQSAKEVALETLHHFTKPYELINDYFHESNMTQKEFTKIKKKMCDPNGQFEQV